MALPKLEDWKAPWEVDLKEGEEPTFDFDKGKRYLHGVLSDKEKLQKQNETLTTERDALAKEKDEKAREGESETDRLKRERDEAVARAEKAEKGSGEKSPAELRLEIALDKGLTTAQARRLDKSLSTKEEIEADADDLLKSWGGSGGTDEEDEDGEDDGPRTRPARQFKNPSDPNVGKAGEDADDQIVANYVANRGGFG